MNLRQLNLIPEEKAHMEALLGVYGNLNSWLDLPIINRITSAHEYGCRQGGGLPVLKRFFPEVKGFDNDDTYAEPPNYGDIHDPKENADLICCLHVIETYPIQVEKALLAMAAHCKYLAISVHAHVSKMHEAPDHFWTRLIHTDHADIEECDKPMHLLYLFKGDL